MASRGFHIYFFHSINDLFTVNWSILILVLRCNLISCGWVSYSGSFSIWKFYTVECHFSIPLNFYLEMFLCEGQGFHHFNKQESRNTMSRNSLSHCRECRMRFGWMPRWIGWRGGVGVLFWSSGYLLIRAKPQARDKWGHLFKRLWEIGGHAHKRQAVIWGEWSQH